MQRILDSAKEFQDIIAELKKESNFYPQVLIKEYPNQNPLFKHKVVIYASTLVRIERDGKWYVVHCVESIVPTDIVGERNLLLKFIDSVYSIQLLYKVTGIFEDVDSSQIDEIERLKNLNKWKSTNSIP